MFCALSFLSDVFVILIGKCMKDYYEKVSVWESLDKPLMNLKKSVDKLKILKIVNSIEHDSGKLAVESFTKLSPLLLMFALFSFFYSILGNNTYAMIISFTILGVYVPAFIWVMIRSRKSRASFRRLNMINIVLDEKR
jgi:hypothetical protein